MKLRRNFPFTFAQEASDISRQLEFGDVLLLLYLMALIREYAWVVSNSTAAWVLTGLASLIALYFYVATKPPIQVRTPKQFWLVVGMPLLIIYGMRVAFPDVSFDVLNYHILHGERGLRGPIFLSGDFFPTSAFNPTPDILTGISRHLLGYRLGTIINYLALLWAGTILNKMSHEYFKNSWLRCAGILLVLFTEHILFEINNYMIDLLALPLLLEATWLAINSGETTKRTRRAFLIGFLLGASLAIKLTNLSIAIPILFIYGYNLAGFRVWRLRKILLPTAIGFVAPLLPFTLYVYRLTGNPVFPVYNGIFKSPYWPITNVFDPRWGPRSLWETILWPVLIFLRPDRLSELTVYSGRISVGFVAAVICFFLAREQPRVRALCFITLLGSLLWSAGSGYIRYALYLELMSGMILLLLAYYVAKSTRRFSSITRLVLQSPLWLLLLVQFYFAGAYVYRYEWSMRQNIFTDYERFREESVYLLRDHSLTSFLSPKDRELFAHVEVWLDSVYKTNALEALLKPEAPIISVRMPEYHSSQEARHKFRQALEMAQGKRLFTLSATENLPTARSVLADRGFQVKEITAVLIPYFSRHTQFNMVLLEVAPPGSATASATTQEVPKGLGLPDSAFNASISVAHPPVVLGSGKKETLFVLLKNSSDTAWPGQQESWKYQVTIANKWLDSRGNKLSDMDGRVALIANLGPGQSVELPLTITAPLMAGEYILEIDAVQEGVAWFSERGSKTLRIKFKVE